MVAEIIVCAILPLALLYLATVGQAVGSRPAGWHYAIDFHPIWQAGRNVLSGISPYVRPESLLPLRGEDIHAFVYPAPAAVAAVPLGALPYPFAAASYTLIGLAALFLALRLLGVRDWRCYGYVYVSLPVYTALSIGTVTPLLFLGIAAAWRYRDRRWMSALAVASVVILKVFLWPLVLWLLFTRRKASAALAALFVAATSLVGWWIIGFAGFQAYPSLLRTLSDVEYATSYSVAALAHHLSGSTGVAYGITALGGTVGLIALFRLARRDSESPFALLAAIVTALITTPILWLHYLALLSVPFVLIYPRLDARWLLPWAFWSTPWQRSHGALWKIVLLLSVAAVLVGVMATSYRARRPGTVAGLKSG